MIGLPFALVVAGIVIYSLILLIGLCLPSEADESDETGR